MRDPEKNGLLVSRFIANGSPSILSWRRCWPASPYRRWILLIVEHQFRIQLRMPGT